MKHLKLFFALFAMLALGVTNAWAEEAALTFDEKAKRTEYSTSKQVWVENGITFTNNKATSTTSVADYAKPVRLYANSSVTVECGLGNMTKIVFTANTTAYASTLKTSIGSTATVNSKQVTVTLDGTSDTFTIAKLSGQVRLDALTVSYTPSTSGGEEPTPTQLTTPANLKEASITETSATLSWDAVANASNYSVTINGNTETVTTNSYSATGLTAGTEYTWSVVAKGDGTNHTDSEAAQHTFTTTAATTPDAGGESTGTATLTFDNVSKRTTFTTSQQVWTENGVTLTNDKASSTSNVADYCNPARFYKNSKITITHTSNKITQIVFDCKSSSYATALQSAIGNSAAISDDKVTVNITPATESYVINALSGGQVQMDALTVTYETSGSGSTEPVVSLIPKNELF